VIGNGIAGQACAEELRARDSECSIVIIAGERHPLYNRVALPRFLRGQVREERVMLRTVQDYERNGLAIHFGTWVTEIDVAGRVVRTDRGHAFGYDALLLATGGRPKPPPWPGATTEHEVLALQTLDDARAVAERADRSERVLVVGGSFIAYELAEGIVHRGGARVTWMMRGPWFLRSVLDAEGGRLCRDLGESAGVEFICGDEVAGVFRHGGRCVAETAGGRRIEFDMCACGVGLDPYVDVARRARIGVRRGIVADSRLRTTAPSVYAAGDVAVFYDLLVGRFNHVGTWDTAEAHGRTAAHNMAGEREDFFDVPTYTTTMFGSTLSVMGVTPDVQPDLRSVCAVHSAERSYRKLFFDGDRLVGAIIIGPPRGRKRLIEMIRSRQRVEGAREELLDPANLA
jgi:3-phenylpropionate/trans-cinnamate dioxygenase ferredoxin reductase subunit